MGAWEVLTPAALSLRLVGFGVEGVVGFLLHGVVYDGTLAFAIGLLLLRKLAMLLLLAGFVFGRLLVARLRFLGVLVALLTAMLDVVLVGTFAFILGLLGWVALVLAAWQYIGVSSCIAAVSSVESYLMPGRVYSRFPLRGSCCNRHYPPG